MARANPTKETQLPKSQPPEELLADEEDEVDEEEDDLEEDDPFDGELSLPTGTWIGRTMSFGASYQGNDPLLMAWPTARDGSES
jgi:hypothetical protein